eukprot:COSAG04_NODE_734_length_10713_cov_2.619748_9_plen_210_part_00
MVELTLSDAVGPARAALNSVMKELARNPEIKERIMQLLLDARSQAVAVDLAAAAPGQMVAEEDDVDADFLERRDEGGAGSTGERRDGGGRAGGGGDVEGSMEWGTPLPTHHPMADDASAFTSSLAGAVESIGPVTTPQPAAQPSGGGGEAAAVGAGTAEGEAGEGGEEGQGDARPLLREAGAQRQRDRDALQERLVRSHLMPSLHLPHL